MTCKNATLPEILELSPRLEDADPGVRRLALIELADLELPEALPLLVAALRGDPDPGVGGGGGGGGGGGRGAAGGGG
ncbi:HEAT repeat domain-containing protein, partial [Pseudomonas aeruginosa]|nr:HEAT repeat domain-containing protein [Pseudomonas aeruginosa]